MLATFCDFCGDELPVPAIRHPREPVTCGARACADWEREELLAIDEAAREAAREDGYERYR